MQGRDTYGRYTRPDGFNAATDALLEGYLNTLLLSLLLPHLLDAMLEETNAITQACSPPFPRTLSKRGELMARK